MTSSCEIILDEAPLRYRHEIILISHIHQIYFTCSSGKGQTFGNGMTFQLDHPAVCLVTVPGFLFVWGWHLWLLSPHHDELWVSCDTPWHLTKLVPEPVGRREKPSVSSFALLLMRKCRLVLLKPTAASTPPLFRSEQQQLLATTTSWLVWSYYDRLTVQIGAFQDGSAELRVEDAAFKQHTIVCIVLVWKKLRFDTLKIFFSSCLCVGLFY